jgi:hypothetical protein
MSTEKSAIELSRYVDEAKQEAIHAYTFLKESGTLSASETFFLSHRIPDTDKLLTVRFPLPWQRNRDVSISISDFGDAKDSILNEPRIDADTVIHAHTPYLASWSLAHKNFPVRYVAAQRHFLAREIPNHLDRTKSVLTVIRERLDAHPELAPPPALLESNGGANFWGRGIVATAQLILLIEEAAQFQSLAEQLGGAKDYTPGNLENQWKRTGLLEKSRAYSG